MNDIIKLLIADDHSIVREGLSLILEIADDIAVVGEASDGQQAMVNMLILGNAGPMAYDLENASFILSFGAGLIEGWGSPGRVINAWGLWREAPLVEVHLTVG